MRQVYRVMSEIILPGMICAALFGAIMGISLLPRLGRHMDIPTEDYSSYEDASQVKEICARQPPKIVRKGFGVYQPGEEILLSQIFEGIDTDGNETSLQVLGIWDKDGIGRMDCYQEAGHKVSFPKRGAYVLELQAMDGQRKSSIQKFVLLADYR
ncbi:MAG: hypothetical protein HFH42_05625 [Lachnospiraceae bacterium]|jgi:hypothetical protein|nr:hypothetical protein [Lachnospiraceae bacterium]